MRYVHFQFCTTWVALSMVCFELGWRLGGFVWLAASVLSFVLWMVARNTGTERQ